VIVGLLAVIAVILGAAALKASAVVTMPLAFAFFLAILVHPIERSLDERLPNGLRWLGLIAAMLTVVGALAFALGLIWISLQPVLSRAPQYLDQLQQKWAALTNWANAQGLPTDQSLDLSGGWVRSLIQPFASELALLWSVPAFLVLVFFFTLLMLLEAPAWRRKTEVALRQRRTTMVLETVSTIAHKVRRFVLMRTVVSLLNGILSGLWLWLMGVDFALFWGVLIFLLNYVPNIGSIIAAIPPTLLAFVQLGFGWAVLVVAGLVAIEQVIGNFLDPRLMGRTLNVSSLVVLLSVIFWSWVWGVAGALLAVPLTVTIILICAHVPALQPIAVLLGGDADDEP
jgi:AI-2 transport protein TqsA